MNPTAYDFKSIPIPGGGFVSGLLFHKSFPDILYARTDVGGLYRFCFDKRTWLPLLDWADEENAGLMYVLSIALDNERPGRIFALCGNTSPGDSRDIYKKSAALLYSEDYGKTWNIHSVPFCVNGNCPTRSCGEKLAFTNDTLYFASPDEGLFISRDFGISWESAASPSKKLIFIKADPDGRWLLLSSTGEPDGYEMLCDKGLPKRDHSLFISVDNGPFIPLPQPVWNDSFSEYPAGYCALNCDLRVVKGSTRLYVTFSGSDRYNARFPYLSFCCECGGASHGRLVRYTLDADTYVPDSFEELTPELPDKSGLCGIAVSSDTIFVSTIGLNSNYIYRSVNGGMSFEKILDPKNTEVIDIDVSYMKPKYNNNIFLVHWMSCLSINPFNNEQLLFNTGTGVFEAVNALSAVRYHPLCDGIEETVHLNIYAPPSGPVQVLDIVGDLGGFAFYDAERQCENSFANSNGDRYITCTNADYTDLPVDTEYNNRLYEGVVPFVSAARGNWRGITKGGLILSLDDCKSFERLDMPYGLSRDIDRACRIIEKPNTNSGWCALSADAKTLLWTMASDWFRLPAGLALRTTDWGGRWERVCVYDSTGRLLSGSLHKTYQEIKFFADRVCPDWFYGFGEAGQIYVSTDCGKSFYERRPIISDTVGSEASAFPKTFYYSGIDSLKMGEIRCCPHKKGVLYLALKEHGLWEMHFDGKALSAHRLPAGETVTRVGTGLSSDGSACLYLSGKVRGDNGVFCLTLSDNTLTRINDDLHQFGAITGITGDEKRPGVVYLATAGRGIFKGTSNQITLD